MEARLYKFKEEEQAQAAYKEIAVTVGPVSQLSGKTVMLGGPAEAVSAAALICEKHQGRLKRFMTCV